jgi:hypothetical protein
MRLRDLLNIEYHSTGEAIDIIPPGVLMDEHSPHIIHNAIEAHLAALLEDVATNRGGDFWTTRYVELRLYYDAQRRVLKSRGQKGARDE